MLRILTKTPPLLDNLEPRLPDLQIDGRLNLLRQLDRFDRSIDSSGVMEGVDQFTQQAVDLLRGGAVRQALDLSREDPRSSRTPKGQKRKTRP